MTDGKYSAGGDRAADDGSPHVRGRWTDMLVHRWPTALGVAVAVLIALDLPGGLEFAALTALMALVYLGAAVLDRRWSAWVVLFAGLPLVFLFPSTSKVFPSAIILVAALAFLVVGVARGQLRMPGGLPLQTAGMFAFGSTVLAALYVDPVLGGKLVGIAILGHAAWDIYHLVRDRVVARSYAEFCAVFDLLLGSAILFLT